MFVSHNNSCFYWFIKPNSPYNSTFQTSRNDDHLHYISKANFPEELLKKSPIHPYTLRNFLITSTYSSPWSPSWLEWLHATSPHPGAATYCHLQTRTGHMRDKSVSKHVIVFYCFHAVFY